MHGIHPGKLIGGRYEVLYLLGSGGMGSVYAAHDTHLGRRVALKVLRPDFAANDSFRQRFLREARIAAQINHPNVTCTYDIGEADAGPYLVQEFLDGQTLDLELPLSPERALQVALDVADALSYIHAQGYVHCDIKPHNIMLVKQDTARAILLDFGIARMQGVDTTTVFATPHYLAPEQSQGALPTAASDLYALGIVLYESVTGSVPFDGPTQHAIIYKHLHAPVPPLEIDSPYAPMLEAIIRALTAKNPESRYSSAAMLRTDLLAVLAGANQLKTTPTKLRLACSRHMVRRWMLGLSLVLLATGVGVVSIGTPASSSDPVRRARWSVVETLPPVQAPAERISRQDLAAISPPSRSKPVPAVLPTDVGMSPPAVADQHAQVEQPDVPNGGSGPVVPEEKPDRPSQSQVSSKAEKQKQGKPDRSGSSGKPSPLAQSEKRKSDKNEPNAAGKPDKAAKPRR